MLRFSQNPQEADKQMKAVIFYLTTFGYIDGDFDASEKTFVREYIAKLVEGRVHGAIGEDEPELRTELTQKYTTHFHEVFENIDRQVRELFTESVAEGENQTDFVHAKLKLRCFEIFKSFGKEDQDQLLDTVDELIQADGQVHPAEQKFRSELATLLVDDPGIELLEDEAPARPRVADPEAGPVPSNENHPFFGRVETHYSGQPYKLATQVKADRALLDRVMGIWDEQRAKGKGRLAGHKTVADFHGQDGFLDDHVYVLPEKPGVDYELTVLGDLHGCYSVLKAALMQADFLAKVNAYHEDPANNPNPKLVLLGDYIDRGMFSYHGVLRTVLQLFATVPDHVYVLRGNHEYYVEFKGNIYGGVKPAEAINTLKPHMSIEVFQHYSRMFEKMPTSLLFDKTLFVHAGIPRDSLIKERWKDLSALNDPDIRFQMMWSDPSSADVIPAVLQEQSARFPFGRLQCQAFLRRIGCHTLVRGHEKVEEGFRRTYDDPEQLLITLFSAGGASNDDLPKESGYRSVTPMAMTIRHNDGQSVITPWKVDYERYNDPEKNAFFAVAPEIEHRVD
ncbi:MAG: serine/threonine protein phosphatase [Deltaproteobacteria bacterium]|nr:serine/threonine protein phosphatase [Deltaproteobacteria bacterium]